MPLEFTQKQHVDVLHNAPAAGPLRRDNETYRLIQQCIHCGFCLPTCPTYAVLGVEMDSPRGRIYQMQAVAEGRLDISNDFVEHMNCCLGCRACETACPSGVQFGKLIEAAREQIHLMPPATTAQVRAEQQHDESNVALEQSVNTTPWMIQLVRNFFFEVMLPSRLVLTLVFAGLKLYQRTGLQMFMRRTKLLDLANALPSPFQGQLKEPEELMDAATGDILPAPLPEVTPAIGPRRYRVGMVSGCIMDQVFHNINEATIRVLAANGCEVIAPTHQTCCGALHVHAGEAERGRALARSNIDVFERYNLDAIIINSAGCGSTLKEYGYLLRDDPAYSQRAEQFSQKVKDVSEFLVDIGLNTHMATLSSTVTYHDACHLVHGQKIRRHPRQLLKSIPGISLVELEEADWCCGSAGIYNITHQEMATALLARKMKYIAATGADIVATGNPGCMMQIAMGARKHALPMEVVHPVQLLDRAYSEGGIYAQPTTSTVHEQTPHPVLVLGIAAGVLAAILLLRRRIK